MPKDTILGMHIPLKRRVKFAMDEFLKPLIVDNYTLCRLAIDLRDTYRHLALQSTEQFLATPVTLPDGTERGCFLAIDVGGSNMRAAFVFLGESTPVTPAVQRRYERSWSIGDHLKMDKPEDLFAWIGGCIADVISAYVVDLPEHDSIARSAMIPLGITFSFPMQ